MIEQLERAAGRAVSRETFDKLVQYVALLTEENEHQNLISASTIADIWQRHILDSAQLVRFAPAGALSWVDIGSGAGLPGIVIACFNGGSVDLIEPRRLRAEFLHRVAGALGLPVKVHACKAERVVGRYDVITARALAPLAHLLKISHHLSTGNTAWVLPKGRSAAVELAEARRSWQGAFHVERSITDAASFIVVGTGVSRR